MSLRVFGVRPCLAAAILALAIVLPALGQPAGGGAGQAVGNPRTLELLRVRTSTGMEWFYVGEPEAPVSAAWRGNVRRADKQGNAPEPSPGFELTNRVVVRADRREELAALVPSCHLYGSTFYTMTGFHGTHVSIGVLCMIWVTVKAFRGKYTQGDHGGVEVIGLYWHFVDLVWILLFTIVYLI